jgi:hypothetical protein
VYFVLDARVDEGQSVTIWVVPMFCGSYNSIVALIRVVVPYLTSVKVVEVPTFGFVGSFGVVTSVFGSISSENVTPGQLFRSTFVVPLGGPAPRTVGAVLSVLSTVTCTVLLADSLPAASVAVTSKVCAVDCSLTS